MLSCRTWRGLTLLALIPSPSDTALIPGLADTALISSLSDTALISGLARQALLSRLSLRSRWPWHCHWIHVAPGNK